MIMLKGNMYKMNTNSSIIIRYVFLFAYYVYLIVLLILCLHFVIEIWNLFFMQAFFWNYISSWCE
jgi:hypothetical protein